MQELTETESYKCEGVVFSLARGERPVQVGWLVCPLACQGKPSCLAMCCPPGHWFQGSSCQTTNNQSSWVKDLEEADYNLEWYGYSNGFYFCEREQFTQVRCEAVRWHYCCTE